jgi:integrase
LKTKTELKNRASPDNLRSRKGIYYAEFRIGGRRVRKSLNTGTLMLAKQRLKEIIVAASTGALDPKNGTELSVAEWAIEYKKAHLATRVQSSAKQCGRLLDKEIVPYLGAKALLSEVTPATILRMRTELWSKTRPATQNRKLALVKHFFSFAERSGFIDDNPARKVKKLKEISRKSLTLSEIDLKRLILACPEPLKSFVRLAAFTGLRFGELQGLRWKNIEYDPITKLYWIKLRNDSGFRTKSGRDRDVPVHEAVIKPILETKKNHLNEEMVFETPKGGKSFHPRRDWRNVIKRLGLKGFTFHGLRRTYGTNLHRNGVPLGSVQALMGHANISQTRGYIDVNSEDLTKAIKGLDKVLENVNGPATDEVWAQNGHTSDFPAKEQSL